MPPDTAHVWWWFQDLSAARSTGMSANPISFTEIDAYARLHRMVMEGWEIGLLRRLDTLALSQTARKGADGATGAGKPEKPPAKPADAALTKDRIRAASKDRRVVKRQPKTKD